MFDFSPTPEREEGDRQPRLTVPIPFLRQSIGSGDLVKSLTDALRIPQCGGCRGRQDAMNGAMGFRPMGLWED
jgi:hypothetical protein